MTAEAPASDPYEVVLADLRAKRDQIDQAISAIETIRGGAPSQSQRRASTSAASDPSPDAAGIFLGMSIPDAVRKLLGARKRAMGNGEIAAALKAGGLVLQSADPANTVGSVVTRRFNQVGDIVRVGRGTWGLAEWYPNRNFRKKPATKAENGDVMSETNGPESLSEPPPDDQPG